MIKYIGISLTIFLLHISSLYAYNRTSVAVYANKYWGDARDQDITSDNGQTKAGYNILNSLNYNSNDYYTTYDEVGGDCANFVSQCLIAGGLNLTDGPGAYGLRWLNSVQTQATIPAVANLKSHLDSRREFGHKQITKPSTDIPPVMKTGDVIIYADSNGTLKHGVIIVNGTGNDVVFNAHTTDRYQRPWTFAYTDTWPTVHFYHFDEESPTVSMKDANGNALADGGTTNGTVYAYVSDSDIGSGTDKIEVRKDNADTGQVVFTDDTDREYGDLIEGGQTYDAKYTLSFSQDGQYFVKVIDHVGNYTSKCFNIAAPQFTVERKKLIFSESAGKTC